MNLVAAIIPRAHVLQRRVLQGRANGAVFQIGETTLAPTVSEPHDTTHRFVAQNFLRMAWVKIAPNRPTVRVATPRPPRTTDTPRGLVLVVAAVSRNIVGRHCPSYRHPN
jgi:hypothetical protein